MHTPLNETERNIVAAHPIFSGLAPPVVNQLTEKVSLQTYKKTDLIFSMGDEAKNFFIIVEGSVRLYRLHPNGNETTIHVFHNQQSFAEAAIFLEHAYPVSAHAVEPTRLIQIPADPIISHIKDDPAFALRILASMSEHLKGLLDEITLLRVPTAIRRTAEFLRRNCPATEGPAEFTLPHNKSILAKRLDIAPEVLSRALSELKRAGIHINRRTVHIDDASQLHMLARAE